VNDAQIKALEQKARAFASVLSTPAGKGLMAALEQTFVWGDLQAKDDREMNFRLGQRDVVIYLRGMLNLSNEGKTP
jgi:hypothetical protein